MRVGRLFLLLAAQLLILWSRPSLRRQMCIRDSFYYINSDDHRQNDCDWKQAYTVTCLPLVRTMIDCLFNITLILESPRINGILFRASGFIVPPWRAEPETGESPFCGCCRINLSFSYPRLIPRNCPASFWPLTISTIN